MLKIIFAVIIIAAAGILYAEGPTGRLNDTGMLSAWEAGGLYPCTAYNTGDTSSYPRQDCRFGRDAQAAGNALSKVGSGTSGFDYTPLDGNGNRIAVDPNGIPQSTPVCVKDNVTNLIWETKTTDGGLHDRNWSFHWFSSDINSNGGNPGYSGGGSCSLTECGSEQFVAAVNISGLCGIGAPWRLPTRKELLSLVNDGNYTNYLHIEANMFPLDQVGALSWYWTVETLYGVNANAWYVDFSNGKSATNDKSGFGRLRLVRSGP